jgi:hypothetical protein
MRQRRKVGKKNGVVNTYEGNECINAMERRE